jgi:hypothetical protein
MVLTNSEPFNETPRIAERTPDVILSGLVASSMDSASFEAWVASLKIFADEQEEDIRLRPNWGLGASSREVKPPLEKLAAGPWTSLGGYFDYSLWPDRERFLELDKAIAAGQELREVELREVEVERAIGMF